MDIANSHLYQSKGAGVIAASMLMWVMQVWGY